VFHCYWTQSLCPISTDNILEAFLSEYRQKSQSSTFVSSTSAINSDLCDTSGEEEEGEEEERGCVPIPELPSGQKLTVVILSTWGDQYYVGLTSIEVFTTSGEMAHIQKVRG